MITSSASKIWGKGRPSRCSIELTDVGGSASTTTSISPISIPTSSVEVATQTARGSDFMAASTRSRSERERMPM